MIDSIIIRNFKCFTDWPIALKNLTILAGANGVGKSSVIQSLLLVRQTIDSFTSKRAIPIVATKENLSERAMILLNGPYLLQLGSSKEIINSKSGSQQIEFTLKSANSEALFQYDAGTSGLSLLSTYVPSNLFETGFNISTSEFYYLNAERIGPRNTQEIREQSFNSTGFQGELTGQALHKAEITNQRLEESDARIFEKSDNKALYKISSQVEFWMKFIVPDIEIRIDPFVEINSVRVSLKKQSSGSDFLHPNNIGFGITYALPIVVSGLIAKKNTALIVENPEAHLHPNGQSKIGQFLSKVASAGVQVIVETHSEHFVNGVRLGCMKGFLPHNDVLINFFDQKNPAENPVIKKVGVTSVGDLTEWPFGFFDQEQQDFAEITLIKSQKNGKSST